MDLNIETFNPAAAECHALVAATKDIIEVDLTNKEQLEKVKRARIDLGKMRIDITKTGKAMREEAVAFQREVIKREKELIEIIEPEEKRLKAFEEKAEEMKERERRIATLPYRRAKVASIDKAYAFEKAITNEELLSMDDAQFFAFTNKLIEEKNAAESKRLAEESARIEAEKAEIARQKEIEEAKERGRQEAEEKAKREAKEKAEQEARDLIQTRIKLLAIRGFAFKYATKSYVNEGLGFDMPYITLEGATDEAFREYIISVDAKIEEVKKLQEQAREEIRQNEEKERLERDAKYQEFLQSVGYDGSVDFYLEKRGSITIVYKKVGEYNDGQSHLY